MMKLLSLAVLLGIANQSLAQEKPMTPAATLEINLDQTPKSISPELFGIFFEDINYAADGGLYAELIQNRSFAYSPTERTDWNSLSYWDVIKRDGAKGGVSIGESDPVHPNNSRYALIEVDDVGGGLGLLNHGFDGIPVTEGEKYDVSMFARLCYLGRRWGGDTPQDAAAAKDKPAFVVRLESKTGEVLGESSLPLPERTWSNLKTTITATQTDRDARFVLLQKVRGGITVDEVSVFPQKTFKNRKNGLRADLAQTIADLKPKFVRFPGGCLAHGDGLYNMYRWKDTIGPIEQRKGQMNIWRYHQSVGLGYFEYFQFCEDIGAAPLPVVPAGVCCQNSGHTAGKGQKGIPLELMPEYVQEVLDLIEYANGPVTSKWGAKRAAAGHPEPFNLKYIGVGNEDKITDTFRERFKLINDALRAAHPEITVIGTVGPAPAGEDFTQGWKFANEEKLAMVDEHYYESPEWFVNNLKRYDSYDRSKARVYLGEYASRGNSHYNALAEAAYMTALERNGDVVPLASYAPLLAKINHTQWNPDLIYFNNTQVFPTINYYVQKLFGIHHGDQYFDASIRHDVKLDKNETITSSVLRDSTTGDLIIKLVNVSNTDLKTDVKINGKTEFASEAQMTLLAGEPGDKNEAGKPEKVSPVESRLAAGKAFACDLPKHSFVVLRLKSTK